MKKLFCISSLLALAFSACNKIIPIADPTKASSNTPKVLSYTVPVYPLTPSGGDDWPQIMNAIAYTEDNPGAPTITFTAGNFLVSQPIVFAQKNAAGTDYNQVTVNMQGITNAQDAIGMYTTNFVPQFSNGPVIAIQQGKDCNVNDVFFTGQYTKSASFTALQMDSIPYTQWFDGLCSAGRTDPYTAIAVDPFDDPANHTDSTVYPEYPTLESYYLPGMSRSGSTALNFDGDHISHFVVGFIITPSNQQNGDNISFTNGAIDNCITDYALTQTQSKTCYINNMMSWGNSHTTIDCKSWGFPRSDGANTPVINGMNIAGNNYQFINAYAEAFGSSFSNVYAEAIFKLGVIWGNDVSFNDCTFDFQSALGSEYPLPDFWFSGYNVTFNNSILRVYNGNSTIGRIIINNPTVLVNGGTMTEPPMCVWSQSFTPSTMFNNVEMEYSYTQGFDLNINTYDNVTKLSGGSVVNATGSNYGYIILPTGNGSLAKVGDLLFTNKNNNDGVVQDWYGTSPMNFEHPIGYVYQIAGDTLYFCNQSIGVENQEIDKVWSDRYGPYH